MTGVECQWPEFVAKEIQEWLARACVRTLYIQTASPWENGYVESFNGRLRDVLHFSTGAHGRLMEGWPQRIARLFPDQNGVFRPLLRFHKALDQIFAGFSLMCVDSN